MTNEEIKTGRKLKEKVREIYLKHPEYKKFKTGMDKYEEFVIKMSEKYGTSTSNITHQILGGLNDR